MTEMAISRTRRFEKYFGFVCPPGCADITPQQFLGVSVKPVGVMQHLSYYPETKYGSGVSEDGKRLAHLEDGIAGMKDAKSDIVAQFGGYWSLDYCPDFRTAEDLQKRLTDEFEIPVVLNWVAIAEALRSVDAKRLSVATGYYRPLWSEATIHFLESAGFEICWWGDVIDQGILADENAKMEVEAATLWDYPEDIVTRACVEAAKRASDCDVVLQTGAGMRTTYVAQAIEEEIGKPFIATDTSLFWALLRQANLKANQGSGSLLGSL